MNPPIAGSSCKFASNGPPMNAANAAMAKRDGQPVTPDISPLLRMVHRPVTLSIPVLSIERQVTRVRSPGIKARVTSVAWLWAVFSAAVVAAATPSPPAKGAASTSPSPMVSRPTAMLTPASVTQSFGKLPDSLAGTWFLSIATPSRQGLIINWNIYRIARRGDGWSVQRYDKAHPSPVDAAFTDAKQRGVAFEPSPTLLKAMRAMVPQLKLLPEAETFQVVALRSADQLPADPPPPPAAKGAKFSLEILDRTRQASLISAVSFYGKDVQADQITGDSHAITIAAAGLSVVPMELSGRFRMDRLE
jgi:hypothetical protein